MKLVFPSLVFVIVAVAAGAPVAIGAPDIPRAGQRAEDFVPGGWRIIRQASGDLDRDRRKDMALVIEAGRFVVETRGCGGDRFENKARPRILLILRARKSGGFQLWHSASRLILRANEGGVYGDPLVSIAIDRGALVISNYGGSNWRWADVVRFRAGKGVFEMIGFTHSSHFLGDGQKREYDYNVLRGRLKISAWKEGNCRKCSRREKRRKICRKSNECKTGFKLVFDSQKWSRPKPGKTVTLDKFYCWNMDSILPRT